MFIPSTLRQAAGDDQVFEELLEIFLRTVPPMVARLRRASELRLATGVAQEAHALKSCLALAGSERMSRRCAELEASAHSAAASLAPETGLAVCDEIDRIVAQVRTYYASHAIDSQGRSSCQAIR